MKIKRSKRYVVQIGVEDIGLFNLDEFMSRLDCKFYFAVFHPKETKSEVADGHYHIYVEFCEKTDCFLVQDYFGGYCFIDIPKDSLEKLACYFSHNGFYKLNVMGEERDISEYLTVKTDRNKKFRRWERPQEKRQWQ